MAIKPLTETRVDEVVELLGFAERPPVDLVGLEQIYRAWCRRIPFDNLRKLVGLHFDMPELPGIDPAEFFAAWQFTGSGSTCWGSNNAIHALLDGLGFEARLHAASMHDVEINHGTTIVTIGGDRWLVDASVHGDVPAPIRDEFTSVEHAGFATNVWPDRGGWVFDSPTADPTTRVPCRILEEMDHAFTLEANEKTRERSPFNRGIRVGINDADGVWLLDTTTLTRIDASGTTASELTDAEVDEWMIETSGHTPQMVAEVRAVLDFQAEQSQTSET